MFMDYGINFADIQAYKQANQGTSTYDAYTALSKERAAKGISVDAMNATDKSNFQASSIKQGSNGTFTSTGANGGTTTVDTVNNTVKSVDGGGTMSTRAISDAAGVQNTNNTFRQNLKNQSTEFQNAYQQKMKDAANKGFKSGYSSGYGKAAAETGVGTGLANTFNKAGTLGKAGMIGAAGLAGYGLYKGVSGMFGGNSEQK